MYKDIKNISIDLTEQCNLNCDYCFTYSNHEKRTLNKELGKILLDDYILLTDAKELGVTWWGGEPFLEWELMKELTEYASNKAKENGKVIVFDVTTNGTLLTEDKFEWIKNNLKGLLISYDGIKESHDCHRKFKDGRGSWDIVENNILKLREAGVNFSLRMSLSVDNVSNFYNNVKHVFDDLKLSNLAYSPVFEQDWTEDIKKELEHQFDLIVEYLIELNKQGKQHKLKHLHESAESIISALLMPAQKRNPCGAGTFYVAYSTDGVMFPCHRFNKHGLSFEDKLKSPVIYGAYIDSKFVEIKNSTIMEDFKNYTKPEKYPKACEVCQFGKSMNCNGYCLATNYDINGDLFKGIPFVCDFEKIQYNASIKMLKYFIDNKLCFNGLLNFSGHERVATCGCYQATYSDMQPASMLVKFLDISRRILSSKDEPKTDEQRQLEQEVLDKTIGMLNTVK